MTEQYVLLASDDAWIASRRLDTRAPAFGEFVEVASIAPDGTATRLSSGGYGDAGRYLAEGERVTWTLRPEKEGPWPAPTELRFVLRWKVRGALTRVLAPRPLSRPRPGATFAGRLAGRWRETAEAFRRAGRDPSRRYVLDLNLAAPGRGGPVEALEYGLSGDAAWRFVGPFMTVALDRPLPDDEGVDLSFFFDRVAPGRPASDTFHPALLVALALVPLLVAAVHVVRALFRRRRRLREAQAMRCPERPEQLSPELFRSLFEEGPPRAPGAGDAWARLRNGGAVAVDRQEPPNLVLRADLSELRRPEAALAGAVFRERTVLPVAKARAEAAELAPLLAERVEAAFAEEKAEWIGEGFAAAPKVAETRLLDAGVRLRAFFVGACLFLAAFDEPLEVQVAAVAVALAAALGLFFLARTARRAGTALDGVLVPAAASLLLAPLVPALAYLPAVATKPFGDVPPALAAWLVLGIGFEGARGTPPAVEAGIRAWARASREEMRERLVRSGGEVGPTEAPWFRAAGLEVSLSEPGVSADDLEAVLGVPSTGRR